MSGQIRHELVGFDRRTDMMAARHEIPFASLQAAKKIADVGPDDPDAAYSYALSWQQAKMIAALLGIRLAADEYEYFLEPFRVPARRVG